MSTLFTGKRALVSYVSTRWNTVYLMFETMLEMKDAMVLYFAEQNLKPDEVLTDQDWKLMTEVTKALRSLYLVTLELSGEKHATLSKVVPIVNLLLEEYSIDKPNQSEIAKECRKLIHDSVQKHFEGIESNEIYACSTIMDPRFKQIAFSTNTKGNHAINQAKMVAVSIAHKDDKEKDEKMDDSESSDDGESTKTKVQMKQN